MENSNSFSKISNSIHQDIDTLWNDCFGDLPLMVQRTLKSYALRKNKEAYTHTRRMKIPDLSVLKNLKVNIDDKHFSPRSVQTKTAQALVNKIIKRLKRGKSRTARYLRYFLKDKKIKISVDKSLSYDAEMSGYNPLTKEIYIDLCAGCFYWADKEKELINEDTLAITIGHEIGHAIEKLNRTPKSEPETISSNSWETESLCDAIGIKLAADAGYSLVPEIETIKKGIKEKREPKQPNPHPPLKNRLQLIEYAELFFKTEKRPLTYFNETISTIEWDATKIPTPHKRDAKSISR